MDGVQKVVIRTERLAQPLCLAMRAFVTNGDRASSFFLMSVGYICLQKSGSGQVYKERG